MKSLPSTHNKAMQDALREHHPVDTPSTDMDDEDDANSADVEHRTASSAELQGVDRRTSFGLSGLSPKTQLIVPDPVMVVGSSHEPGIQLPMQAVINRQEAILSRERDASKAWRYRLTARLGWKVHVNQLSVTDCVLLNDGDVLQFENSHCRSTFRQPEQETGTALIQRVRRSHASFRISPGLRGQFDTAVLAGDEVNLAIRPWTLSFKSISRPRLTLRRAEYRCHVQVTGGVVFADSALPSEVPDDLTQTSSLRLPDQLTIHAERRGDELLQDAVESGVSNRTRVQMLDVGVQSFNRTP